MIKYDKDYAKWANERGNFSKPRSKIKYIAMEVVCDNTKREVV